MPLFENTNKPSTFKQNENFPINVIFEYDNGSIQFPINPETLKQVIPSQAVTENIESLGEVSIPQRPSLSEMTFNSFFWKQIDQTNPENYVRWIKNWQKSRKPAKLTISNLSWFNMEVTCESFSHWVNAGEEGDIYFEITLKEYKRFKAVKVDILTGNILTESAYEQLMGTVETEKGESVAPVRFNVKRPPRLDIRKPPVPTVIETKDDDSIVAITRRNTDDSSNWKELYEENQETFDTIIPLGASSEVIASDIPLETPKSWNPEKFISPSIDLEKALEKTEFIATIFSKLDQLKTIANDVEIMLEDFEQSEGAMQEFINSLEDMYSIFQPYNFLSPLESAKHALEDIKAMADFPAEAVGSVDQMIEIIADLLVDIAEFIAEW